MIPQGLDWSRFKVILRATSDDGSTSESVNSIVVMMVSLSDPGNCRIYFLTPNP